MTAATPPSPVPTPTIVAGFGVSILAMVLIALGEVDNLIDQLAQDGRTYSPNGLTGLTRLLDLNTRTSNDTATAGWTFLFGPHDDHLTKRVPWWLRAYAVLDLAFIALYTWISLALLKRWKNASPDNWQTWWGWTWTPRVLCVAAGLDVTESILIVTGSFKAMSFAPHVLPCISIGKWCALILTVALAAVGARTGATAIAGSPAAFARRCRALYTHRYSLLVVVPLAALGLAKGPDLLEQLPDIQRQWIDGGLGPLIGRILVSGFMTALVAVTLFIIGRLRSHNVWMRTQTVGDPPVSAIPDQNTRPVLWIWFAGPALMLCLAAFAKVLKADVSWPRLATFCAVPLIIGGASCCLRAHQHTFKPADDGTWTLNPKHEPPQDGDARWLWRKRKRITTLDEAHTTVRVGDALAIFMIVLPGLGLVRALTASVALSGGSLATITLIFGVLTALLGWPAGSQIINKLNQASAAAPPQPPTSLKDRFLILIRPGAEPATNRKAAPLILATAIIAAVGLATCARPISAALGVIPTFLLGALTLTTIVAACVTIQQRGGSPEFFWLPVIRVASTPVTTLLILTAVLATTFGGGANVHGLRNYKPSTASPAALTPTQRPNITTAFNQWTNASECTRELPNTPFHIRPLLLYAAEGGGIRAATWTALGLDTIATKAKPNCAAGFMSSGASGGAVGLTIADITTPGTASQAVQTISGPDALAAATVGLTITDTIYAATGVPLLTRDPSHGGSKRWLDRAGNIETIWEEKITGPGDTRPLRDPFLRTKTPGKSITGSLVLNSTSATTLCRALISQVALGSGAGTQCSDRGSVPASIDLLPLAHSCGITLTTSTAALLASRFPFVTPSGALCKKEKEQQLIDGGYADNTGIGTLVDLSSKWMPLLRTHNDKVIAANSGTLLVPMLVYFDNGTGSDLAAQPDKQQLEPLVPILTRKKAQAALSETDPLLRRAIDSFAVDQLWSGPARGKRELQTAVEQWRPHAVHVVYQHTTPAVAAPLGWVLSESSRDSLVKAIELQATTTTVAPVLGVPSIIGTKGYGTMSDLLRILG